MSISPTELGTRNHPYKEVDSVMVEIMNFHSHSDRTINVFVMEYSSIFLKTTNVIANITMVQFESYSDINTDAAKARVIGVKEDDRIVAPAMPTKFSILSKFLAPSFYYIYMCLWLCLENKVLKYSEMISSYSGFTDYEKALVGTPDAILKPVRSGLSMKNFQLMTDYESSFTVTPFFDPVNVYNKGLVTQDLYIIVQGSLLTSVTEFDWRMDNSNIDFYITRLPISNRVI